MLTRRTILGGGIVSLAVVALTDCGAGENARPFARQRPSAKQAPPAGVGAARHSSQLFPLHRPTSGHHFLQGRGGAPFFLLGDTAWSIAVSASKADVIRYLDTRKSQGFNAFTFNAIEAEFAGGNGNAAPNNYYGHPPFRDPRDFTTALELYWENVDFIVEQAALRDMLCIIFPAYEGFAQGSQGWYPQMAMQGVAKLQSYGAWLGKRYLAYDNILWIAGGDNDPADRMLTKAVVNGIRSVSDEWLFGWHGARNSSAQSFWGADTGWLDLNTIYDSAGRAAASAEAAYRQRVVKPFLRIEDTYENPVGQVPTTLIRWLAWSSALQGGTGAIYGDVSVWRFNGPGLVADPTAWVAAMERPAGSSMQYLRRFCESRDWTQLMPDAVGAPMGNLTAFAADGSFGVAYMPDSSKQLALDLGRLAGPRVSVRWYDPTTGEFFIEGRFAATGNRAFVRPALNAGQGGDWALVLQSEPA